MSGGNKSYNKGYRFEDKARKLLEPYGEVERAHASGAYTGEADLTWTYDCRKWTIDCKAGDQFQGKRHRERLEKADMCFDGPDRKIILVTLTLPKLLELMGCSQGISISELIAIAKEQGVLRGGSEE